jgi:glucose-1-phosphate thymidylyltransferase
LISSSVDNDEKDRAFMADHDIVGLLPAAGFATRIAPLPCSKEIYPIGARLAGPPKAACDYLLEKMASAGIKKAYLVLREAKWDIPRYLGDGSRLSMRLAYLMAGTTAGPPYTLDRAYPFVRDSIVAFGFPDILFVGDDAFSRLLSAQAAAGADLVIGLFPADCPERMDMVDVDDQGRVRNLVIQPRATALQYSWDAAVWTPTFTDFMHNHLAPHSAAGASAPELSVGHVIQAAIRAGLAVEGVQVSQEPYYDIGTPEGLARAIQRFTPVD